MSVRTRVAGILAAIMLVPLLVAGLIVGFVAPRQQATAAQDRVSQAAASLGLLQAEICRGLGDTAKALALDVRADDAKAAALQAAGRRAGSFAAVIRGGSVVGLAGALPSAADGATPTAAQLSDLSCSQDRVLAGSQPVLAEAVDVAPATGSGQSTATAVVGLIVDANELASVRSSLGLSTDVELAVSCHGGGSDATLGGTFGRELIAAAGGSGAASVGPYRVGVQKSSTAGQPCGFAAAAQSANSTNVQRGLVALLVVAVILGIGLVLWLARQITGPVLALTDAAERVAAGDLAIRLPVVGKDELGRLSGSFNHMTAELESKLGEIARSRDMLRDNVRRLGDALQRTHDLDGLLGTVLGAAAAATQATRATAWLVEGGSVVARVPFPPTGTRGPLRRLPIGVALAGEVAADGVPRRTGHGHDDESTVLAGVALAAPLKRGHSTLGVILVEREPQSAPFDDEDEEALVSLAGPAGIAVDNVLLHREAQRLSVTDPLTGAGNLRHMTTTLAREVERATRFERPLGLLLLDLDHFKRVNDTYGHTVGDAVLRELARRLHQAVREVDTVARYGGEEFVVICPETDAEGATRLAERVCQTVRDDVFVVGSDHVVVTVSVGVASLPQNGVASGDLVRAADEALYAAKHAGRDQWRRAEGLPAAR